jgi:hypothetical protein
VWEVRLQDVEDTRTFDWQQAKKDEAVPPTPVTVTVTALGAEPQVTNAAPAAGSTAFDVSIANNMGSFPGAAVGLPLGAIRRERVTLRAREQRVWDITVPPGSTMLTARARSGDDADIDVYLFDCTGKECAAARADADPRGPEQVTVTNPAAGRWVAVVDHTGSASAPATVEYEDVMVNPSFGYVAVTDQPAERKAGSSWTTRANAWMAGTLPPGRDPWTAIGIQAQPKGAEPFFIGVRELRSAGERASPGAPSPSTPPPPPPASR